MQVPTGSKLPEDGRVQMYPCHSFEFHLVLLAIDPDLGKPEIRRYVIGHDCGTVINPHIVKGMTLGGIAHGIGAALLEEFVYDERGPADHPELHGLSAAVLARSAGSRDRASLHAVAASPCSDRRAPAKAAISARRRRSPAPSMMRVAPLGISFNKLPIRISAISDAIADAQQGKPARASHMIIDCHAHLVPPSLLDAIRAAGRRIFRRSA